MLNLGSVNAELKFRWSGSPTGDKDLWRRCPTLDFDQNSTWLRMGGDSGRQKRPVPRPGACWRHCVRVFVLILGGSNPKAMRPDWPIRESSTSSALNLTFSRNTGRRDRRVYAAA